MNLLFKGASAVVCLLGCFFLSLCRMCEGWWLVLLEFLVVICDSICDSIKLAGRILPAQAEVSTGFFPHFFPHFPHYFPHFYKNPNTKKTNTGMNFKSFFQRSSIYYLSNKNVSVEWSRPFGLDVLVWGLDPNYNVFS